MRGSKLTTGNKKGGKRLERAYRGNQGLKSRTLTAMERPFALKYNGRFNGHLEIGLRLKGLQRGRGSDGD